MTWRRLHLVIGGLGLLAFIIQGQYMARALGVPDLPDVQRMLYRSAHIYLMQACAINLCVGFFIPVAGPRGVLQKLASLSMLAGPPLLLASFFTEISSHTIDRPLLSIALYLMFGAAMWLVIATAWRRFRRRIPG
jgi:uncharacterized membrane protein